MQIVMLKKCMVLQKTSSKKCIVTFDKKPKKLKLDKPYITKEILEQKTKVETARKKLLKKNNDANEIEFINTKKEICTQSRRNEYYGLKMTRAGKNSKQI